MRPRRPSFARVIETTLALTDFETKVVLQRAGETRDERIERIHRRSADIDDPIELQARSRQRASRLEMRRARALPPADAWRRLVPNDAPPLLERWFAGSVVQKGGTVSPQALHVAWGAWEVSSEPATIDSVLALASDIEGMHAAEAIAVAMCRSLGLSPSRVTWFVETEPRLVDFRGASAFRARVDEELSIPRERLTAGEIVFQEPPRNPGEDAWRFVWSRLAKRDLVRANISQDMKPLVEIARGGYALVDVVEDAVVLAAAAPRLDRLLDVLV